jgi:hypothetical protein
MGSGINIPDPQHCHIKHDLLEVEVDDDVIEELLDLEAGVVLVGDGDVARALRRELAVLHHRRLLPTQPAAQLVAQAPRHFTPRINYKQRHRSGSGSESGYTGSTCFWASWIRIRILL